jgi:hypothetical protein
MTPVELGRMLALVGVHLPTAIKSRFFSFLPKELHESALKQADAVQNLAREHLSIVEQVLLSDLEALFGDKEVTNEIEALPLRVSDVLALVLRQAPIPRSADFVRRLPDDMQCEILHVIAAQSWAVWDRRLGAAESAAMAALRDGLGLVEFEASPEIVSKILHHIQAAQDVRRNLTCMYEKDPDSTGHIQDSLFGFDSLIKLPDRELQDVLQGVDHWDLILAMRSAPANMRRKVLSNLSARRAALFTDNEATLKEIDDAQVEMMQHQILDRARLLYEAGAIRTYLGSLAGQDSELELSQAVGASALPDGKSFQSPDKGRAKKNYGVGILVILLLLGGGYGAVTWFGQRHLPQSDYGKGKTIQTDQEEDEPDVAQADTRVAHRRSSKLGKAAILSGTALLMTGEKVRTLAENELKPGDKIKTGAAGRASVALSNELGQLQVEPETEVQFGQPEQAAPGPPRLDLRVGNIWVQVQDPTLEVTSPLAQVTGSKGALYHLRITLNATTILSVHRGTVWVQALEKGGLHVLGVGQRLRIEPGGEIRRDRHTEVSKWVGGRE